MPVLWDSRERLNRSGCTVHIGRIMKRQDDICLFLDAEQAFVSLDEIHMEARRRRPAGPGPGARNCQEQNRPRK